jgi:hypothetical protein
VRLHWIVLLAALAAGSARDARANPRVVLVESAEGPRLPALAAQVRLQGGDVDVVPVHAAGATGPGYAVMAAKLAASHDATLVIWLTTQTTATGEPTTYTAYAVAGSPGRAVVGLPRRRGGTASCCWAAATSRAMRLAPQASRWSSRTRDTTFWSNIGTPSPRIRSFAPFHRLAPLGRDRLRGARGVSLRSV